MTTRRFRLWLALLSLIACALTATASGESEKVLYTFTGVSDGSSPTSLTADSKGNLYGTTTGGGNLSCNSGCGTVFELTPVQGGGWSKTTLYQFTGGSDGSAPLGTISLDIAGDLYGTTYSGGDATCQCGVVFELSPTGSGWNEATLYTFTGANGWGPNSGIILDANGNLYGTTIGGGVNNYGTVFELSFTVGLWKETFLYSFSGLNNADGESPAAGLTFDTLGNLYGTTLVGGDPSCNPSVGCGTVFELISSSGTWNEKVLYSFKGGVTAAFLSVVSSWIELETYTGRRRVTTLLAATALFSS